MQYPSRRFLAGASFMLLALSLVACGVESTVVEATPSPPRASQPAAPTAVDAQARAEYSATICPIFERVAGLDGPLRDLRALGAEDGDIAAEAEEIDAVVDELGTALDDLEAVPGWEPGNQIRFLLISALHEIRTRLLLVAEDPTAPGAAEDLATTPLIASDAMDRAMSQALAAGFECGPAH